MTDQQDAIAEEIERIEATEAAYRTGMMSHIRAELSRIADEVSAKSTRVAIAIPGKEIAEAMFRLFDSVPNVPDYDPELAQEQVWSSAVEHNLDEVPPDPSEVRVRALPSGKVEVRTGETTVGEAVAELDPEQAEQFFLAGLAATWYAKTIR